MTARRRIPCASFALALALGAQGARAQAPRAREARAPDSLLPPPPIEVRAPREIDVGYHHGRVVLQDRARELWLSPGGRVQLDGVAFVGDGVLEGRRTPMGYERPDLAPTMLVRRARIEAMAGALDRYTAHVAVELGTAQPAQNGPSPRAGHGPQLQTAWLDARIAPLFHVMAGQINAPFTMENRTSSSALDLPERALVVRALVAPAVREVGVMFWGVEPARRFEYYAGLFAGDGPNQSNRDANGDVIGRVVFRPLLGAPTPVANLHLGLSGWYGLRGAAVDWARPPMDTPGGYQFFRSAYGSGARAVAVVPDGDRVALAAEVDLPYRRLDARAEAAYLVEGTREMAAAPAGEPARLAGDATRLGLLYGWGFYLQLAYWVAGQVGVNGPPGGGHAPVRPADGPPRPPLPLPQGAQIVARVQAVDFVYHAEARGTAGAPGEAGDRAGRYAVWGLSLGVNYWASAHVRLSAHYEQFFLGTLPPNRALAFDENHALGPRNARGPVGTFGELTLRAALAF